MSSNRQGLKRNVRLPNRYENSDVNSGKRGMKAGNGSSSSMEKEDEGKKADPVVLSQDSVESGEIVESEEPKSKEMVSNDGIAVNSDVSVNPTDNSTVHTNNAEVVDIVLNNMENVDNHKENMVNNANVS